MKKSFLLGALVFAVFVVLVSLGNWQVRRLAWKTALIEQLNGRIRQPAISMDKVLARFGKGESIEYLPVRLRGRFVNETEKHLYTLDQHGQPGWNIYTLMKTADRAVYVNRGFVPYKMKKLATRREGVLTGEVELTGLVRLPRAAKTFLEVDNQPRKNEWFWPSLAEMSAVDIRSGQLDKSRLVPLFVDQSSLTQAYKWPRPGTTRIKITNRHLGYVITWYGLALSLLGVYGFFLYSRKREIGEQK